MWDTQCVSDPGAHPPGWVRERNNVKTKVSATVEERLVEFLDALPGQSRSEKLEFVLERYQKLQTELDLRQKLAVYYEDDEERSDREGWELTVAESQWRE